MDIGNKLKKYRENKGLSIYGLSKATGIAQQNLKRIEENLSLPSLDSLEKITSCLSLTLAELFSENELCCYLTPEEKDLLDKIRALDMEEKNFIKHTLEILNR